MHWPTTTTQPPHPLRSHFSLAGPGAASWASRPAAHSYRNLTSCLTFLTIAQDLVDGLVQLGVKASCTLGTGCPPVEIIAEGLPSGKVGSLLRSLLCCWQEGCAALALWWRPLPLPSSPRTAPPAASPLPTLVWAGNVQRLRGSALVLPVCCLQVSLSGSVSSQYLTALLMAAPLATGPGEH